MSTKQTVWLGLALLVLGALIAAFGFAGNPMPNQAVAAETAKAAAQPAEGLELATFGSGCFWCTESDFDKVAGVVSTISGYMGGKTQNPTYKSVSSGTTGHAEVLQVAFDPNQVTYKQLLDHYWRTTDIIDGGGQFCDRGSQYRPVIFAHTPEQKRLAETGLKAIDDSKRFDKPVAVEIADAAPFTPAEDYHQDYYKKNPNRYAYYRFGCGRDRRIKQLWGEVVTH
ncbi:MAG: peptide-methionine (S)-S-oxide reductase MsrA [Alphaproteobacteria bacterium]|nr:peptide-methionine (S)-S-oxide reductase MsrA [Alphaproteobacteria bacterium]